MESSFGETRTSMGALLIGGLVSVFLTGIGVAQAYFYWRVYSKDTWHVKSVVAVVSTMDFTHTILVCIATWSYLVDGYGNGDFDHIMWSIGATVTLTALVTFLSHCFFVHRIYVVSRRRKMLPIILGLLSCFRLAIALVSTVQMITIGSFRGFVTKYNWAFTLGLSTAAALDFLITGALCYYLQQSKSGFTTMNEVIDILIRYTVETGMITCVAAIISLICWLVMPYNLIFLTMHFTICKFYSNCFLATLNCRETLRARSYSTSSYEKNTSVVDVVLSSSSHGLHPAPHAHAYAQPRTVNASVNGISVKIETFCDARGDIAEENLRSSPLDSGYYSSRCSQSLEHKSEDVRNIA